MSPKRLQEWQKRLLRLSAEALDRGDEAEALRLWRAAKLR